MVIRQKFQLSKHFNVPVIYLADHLNPQLELFVSVWSPKANILYIIIPIFTLNNITHGMDAHEYVYIGRYIIYLSWLHRRSSRMSLLSGTPAMSSKSALFSKAFHKSVGYFYFAVVAFIIVVTLVAVVL